MNSSNFDNKNPNYYSISNRGLNKTSKIPITINSNNNINLYDKNMTQNKQYMNPNNQIIYNNSNDKQNNANFNSNNFQSQSNLPNKNNFGSNNSGIINPLNTNNFSGHKSNGIFNNPDSNINPSYMNSNNELPKYQESKKLLNLNSNTNINPLDSNVSRNFNNQIVKNIALQNESVITNSMTRIPISRSFTDLKNLSKSHKNIVISQKVNKIDLKMSNIECDTIAQKELRTQIEEKTKNVTELRNNRNFFKEEFQEKLKVFVKKIQNEIKQKIYYNNQKRNLHYIYKYYENLKKNIPQNLDKNLTKVTNEIKDKNNENDLLMEKNQKLALLLGDIINEKNLIKSKKEIVQNLSKTEINGNINQIVKENHKIKEALSQLESWKKMQLYNMKMKYELKGRFLMKKEALKLAIELHDQKNVQESILAQKGKIALDDLEYKEQLKESNVYYQLMEKKNKLKIELERLNFMKDI